MKFPFTTMVGGGGGSGCVSVRAEIEGVRMPHNPAPLARKIPNLFYYSQFC